MRTMNRHWLWMVLLVSLIALLRAQEPSQEPIRIELHTQMPDQALLLKPGETVTFIVTPFLKAMESKIDWFALFGEVLSVSNGKVVYRAPTDERVDFVLWSDPKTKQYVSIAIVTKCIAGTSRCKPERIGGVSAPVYRVPASTSTQAQFYVMQRSSGEGFSVCQSIGPLNPPPPGAILNPPPPGAITTSSPQDAVANFIKYLPLVLLGVVIIGWLLFRVIPSLRRQRQ